MIKLKCVFFFHVLGKSRSIDEKKVNVPRHRLDKIKILDEVCKKLPHETPAVNMHQSPSAPRHCTVKYACCEPEDQSSSPHRYGTVADPHA